MARIALFALMLMLVLVGAGPKAGSSAQADDGGHDEEEDHDAARAAVGRGEAMPLADVLAAVAPNLPGEIVEVEFEREDGHWIYEFKVIDATGRLHEVYVDASNGRILSAKED
jgi:uncharacterized membrane protein YkoI